MSEDYDPPRITRAEALHRLGVSSRHFTRLAAQHKIQPVGKRKDGKAQESLYSVESIEYLRSQRPNILQAEDSNGRHEPAEDRTGEDSHAEPWAPREASGEDSHNRPWETQPAIIAGDTPGHVGTLLAQAISGLTTELAAAREREERLVAERDAALAQAGAAQHGVEAIRAALQEERDKRLAAEWAVAALRPIPAPSGGQAAEAEGPRRRWRLWPAKRP